MERLTVNVTGATRRDSLMGRPYLVAPMTMIVPGVLHGSRGPLLYEREELAKNVAAWNHMPILLRHPPNGSGRTAETLNKSGLGMLLNTGMNGKGLGAEAWFDIERTNAVAPGTIDALERGEKSELSTGLGLAVTTENGVFNGVEYVGRTHNYEPDHLAIFRDGERGACSVRDGCGVNNEAADEDVSPEKAQKILDHGKVDGKPLTPSQKRHFRALASKKDKGMSKNENTSDRDALIESLVTNCGCEREEVEGLDDKGLALLEKVANAQPADPPVEGKGKAKPAEKKKAAEVKNKEPATQSIEEWLVANDAPERLRQIVQHDRYIERLYEGQKAGIVENIRESPISELTQEDIETISTLNNGLEILERIESSFANAKPAHERRADPPHYYAAAVGNRQPTRKPKPLGLPEWDFAPAQTK